MITQSEGIEERNSTVVEQLQAAFERDWFSRYTRSLQANKIPVCNKHHVNRLVSVKASHLDNGPVPISKGQHDNGPAPMRNHHKADGQTGDKTRPHDDRLSKGSHQQMVPVVPLMESNQEWGRIKMSHSDNTQTQIKGKSHDNPVDLPGQSAESSGFREISNGPL